MKQIEFSVICFISSFYMATLVLCLFLHSMNDDNNNLEHCQNNALALFLQSFFIVIVVVFVVNLYCADISLCRCQLTVDVR